MRPSFNESETKERQYLKDYVLPILNEKYNDLRYKFSDINSKDRKDMLIQFKLNGEPKTAVYESKIRTDIKLYYEQQGLIMELDKYRAIKQLHPNISDKKTYKWISYFLCVKMEIKILIYKNKNI